MTSSVQTFAGLDPSLTPIERGTLVLYRLAVRRIHIAYAPYHSHKFGLRLFRPDKPDEAKGLPRSDFLALAQAVRCVYLQKERCNFRAVAQILDRSGNAQIREDLKLVRADWERALSGRWLVRTETHSFNPRSALETWFNAEAFHREPDLQGASASLLTVGIIAEHILQSTVWMLARTCLALDCLVVEFIGGDSLPLPPEPLRQTVRL